MRQSKSKIWIRLAGNAANVKAGHKHGWRCFLRQNFKAENGEEIPLKNWTVIGTSTPENFIPGTNGSPQMSDQVVAWIDFFGDAWIERDVLNITLRNPNNGR